MKELRTSSELIDETDDEEEAYRWSQQARPHALRPEGHET